MVMFDPQYIRPDDVGTQRNKTLILAPSVAVPPTEATAYRPRDQASGNTIPTVTHERRQPLSQDRRRKERREQDFPALLDTRSYRERRLQLRRKKDSLDTGSEPAVRGTLFGINEVI